MAKAKFFSIAIVTALVLSLGSAMLAPGEVLAQPPYWANTYGGTDRDSAHSIQETQDLGYIVAGTTRSFGAGGEDFWVLKLDLGGNVAWQKTYGGANNESANSIQQTQDGGYIVAGRTESFGAGESDFWVLKLDKDGNVTWQKTYGGTDYDEAYSIQQTQEGGYIVAGWTESFGAGDYDFWVLKLDKDGNVAWQKTYVGAGDDHAFSIQQTQDLGYIVAGSAVTLGAGYDFWLLKLDSDGNVTWQKSYGGDYDDWARSVQQTQEGGYIVAGGTESFGGNLPHSSSLVLKLDSGGNVTWQKTYGGSVADTVSDEAYSIQQTQDLGYIVAGRAGTLGGFWVFKLDSGGNVNWQKIYFTPPGAGSANSVQQIQNGEYIVTGATANFGAGGEDFWVLKLDSVGSIPDCPYEADCDAYIFDTTVGGADTAIDGVVTAVTPAATDVTFSDTDCTIETQCYYGPPVYTVTFNTVPADTGEITFDGVNYGDGDTVGRPAETYDIVANPAADYIFDTWETEDDISVADTGLDTTTCTVSGDGTLRMVQTAAPPPYIPGVPTVNQWGIVAMIALFAGLLAWAVRRRRLASGTGS
ncbi:MAG: hypothetical protein WB564_03940 [Dehalococcoidia bacterium]